MSYNDDSRRDLRNDRKARQRSRFNDAGQNKSGANLDLFSAAQLPRIVQHLARLYLRPAQPLDSEGAVAAVSAAALH